jgi:hypothetical protein
MEFFLTILGSVASIGSVPLSLYLYIRSREARQAKVKGEIVRVLSFHIGQGRPLTAFEVRSVVDSKLRESRLKVGSITEMEIVQDLVTEIISSPLLTGDLKSDIILQLSSLADAKTAFLPMPSTDPQVMSNQSSSRDRLRNSSTIFGLIAILATLGATLIDFTGSFNLLGKNLALDVPNNLLLGLVASLFSISVTVLISILGDARRAKKHHNKKPASGGQ